MSNESQACHSAIMRRDELEAKLLAEYDYSAELENGLWKLADEMDADYPPSVTPQGWAYKLRKLLGKESEDG